MSMPCKRSGLRWAAATGGQPEMRLRGLQWGLLLLLLALSPLPLRASAGEFDVAGAIADLRSDDFGQRLQGFQEISARMTRGQLTPSERRDLTAALVADARLEEPHPELESTPLLAIELLGELESAEAIPLLLARLLDYFPRFVVSDLSALPPPAVALGKIGPPAIAPILDRASSASAEEWKALRSALQLMKDQETVRSAVRQRLRADVAGTALERLRALQLAWPSSSRNPPPPGGGGGRCPPGAGRWSALRAVEGAAAVYRAP